MKCNDEVVRVVDSKHLQGNSKKTGKPYDFHTLVVGDSDLNKFEVTVDRGDLVDGALPAFLLNALETKGEIVADFDFVSSENGVKVKMVNVRVAR